MEEDKSLVYKDEALRLAQCAAALGEVPVGAVIVRLSDGQIIGRGYNTCEKGRSPLLHAEMSAIKEACAFLGGWRLEGTAMYVTLEPCTMCAGAVLNARIDSVFYGTPDTGVRGAAHLLKNARCYEDERCAEVLKTFFGNRRIKMDRIKLVKAETDDQLKRTAALADEIWHEYFPSLLGSAQTDYMVNRFCTFEAEKENIRNEGYIYYIIKKGGEDIGYTAVKPDGERLFLSKLYLKAEHRGKGYSRQAVDMHREYARKNGLVSVWLTVNKGNFVAIRAYEGIGFKRTGSGVTDIGSGFVMDDHFYEIKA
ncbi:MAG: GNAT family N-acetyltransferase [Oscillospiraceae bacterium]|nr:GNAT family N-acetyltransferase [Oscillospiraceae bacterium]